MSKKLNDIPTGTLVLLSQGAYSDYYVCGVVRAEKTIPVQELLDDFVKNNPTGRAWNDLEADKFIAFLSSEGYLSDVEHTELHLGDYGMASEVEIIE